jgi:signal transduction histidine kinase
MILMILNIFLAGLLPVISVAFISVLYLYVRSIHKKRGLLKEIEEMNNMLEQRVKERTWQLEMTRDSVSEYAVQKFELVQELEMKNHQIVKQKDDLLKQSEKLKQAYEEIKKLDAFRQQMFKMIVHDIKNPLNVVLNALETMEVPEKSAEIIRQESYAMLGLVMDILDVNKFEDSKMRINYENINLEEPVNRLIGKFSYLSRSSSVELINMVPELCMISADLRIIERVLENLVSNAVKFTPPGGCVRINASEQGDMVRVEVIDNGIGIPGKLVSQIFDEYVQEETNSAIYTTSTGIGLTYCKFAVEAHGGEIGLISKQGEGTTVWFLLQKGTGKKKINAVPVISKASKEKVDLYLDNRDVVLIRPFLDQIKKTGIYEVSSILRLLGNEIFNSNERLQSWKDAVELAVFSADKKQFSRLTDL